MTHSPQIQQLHAAFFGTPGLFFWLRKLRMFPGSHRTEVVDRKDSAGREFIQVTMYALVPYLIDFEVGRSS